MLFHKFIFRNNLIVLGVNCCLVSHVTVDLLVQHEESSCQIILAWPLFLVIFDCSLSFFTIKVCSRMFLEFLGWMPTRRLIDVVLGLDSLFTDLIDFDDALNAQAAQQWSTNKVCIKERIYEKQIVFSCGSEKAILYVGWSGIMDVNETIEFSNCRPLEFALLTEYVHFL